MLLTMYVQRTEEDDIDRKHYAKTLRLTSEQLVSLLDHTH